MNLGLIAMLNQDYKQANELFGAAAGVPENADALGTYYLTKGDLQKAVTAFGDSKTNNAALARILDKDYSGARSILNDITLPDATTWYLKAVTDARTGNRNDAVANLRKAVKLDPKLANRAQSDLEFAGYDLSSL